MLVSPYAGTTLNTDESIYIPLSNRFVDNDGDTLTYTFTSSNSSIATASLAANNLDMVIKGISVGSTEVTVTAYDNHGGTVTMTFTISVTPPLTSSPTGDISVLNTPKVDEIFVYAPKGFTVKLYDSEIGGNLIGQNISKSFDDHNGRGPVLNDDGEIIYRADIQIEDISSVSKVYVTFTEPGKRESIRVLAPVNSESRIVSKNKNIVQVNDVTNFITVKPSATIGEIKNAIKSKNGTNQSYTFRYNVGDDNFVYSEAATVSSIYVSWVDVLAEDGTTKGQYTIDFIK
ncbi:Ig-like domain-containing protein [Psychrobacillus sp. NPDC093180]|uniref:Ig-like domain-containing protein n=1 Tax=Psychrobacillus sp. NPDC093180 TaxID=3364489 RepID=UPI003826F597